MNRSQVKLPTRQQLMDYARDHMKLSPLEIATSTDRKLYEIITEHVRKMKSEPKPAPAPAETKSKPAASYRIYNDPPPAPVSASTAPEKEDKVPEKASVPENLHISQSTVVKTLHRICGRFLPNLSELHKIINQLDDEHANSYFTETELRLVRKPLIKKAVDLIQHAYDFRQKRIALLKSEGADPLSITNLQKSQEELRMEVNQILEYNAEQAVLQEKEKDGTALLESLFG